MLVAALGSEKVRAKVWAKPLPELGTTETVVGGAGGFTLMPTVIVALA